jgi:hypothetical protein
MLRKIIKMKAAGNTTKGKILANISNCIDFYITQVLMNTNYAACKLCCAMKEFDCRKSIPLL